MNSEQAFQQLAAPCMQIKIMKETKRERQREKTKNKNRKIKRSPHKYTLHDRWSFDIN